MIKCGLSLPGMQRWFKLRKLINSLEDIQFVNYDTDIKLWLSKSEQNRDNIPTPEEEKAR